MTNATLTLTVTMCASLLWAGTTLATPTAQQQCDYARITAWAKYVSCVDAVAAKGAKGVLFDPFAAFAAFAKCRHSYFKAWTGFQSKASLAGSTCKLGVDNRFTEDLLDGVVTDNLSGLVWELKGDKDAVTDFSNPHDADNTYSWSASSNIEDGTAFTTFLTDPTTGLNVTGFAGANGWRLPTLAELQTIVLDFPCTGAGLGATCRCSSNPCIDGTFDAASTQSNPYWSATSYVPVPSSAWVVNFNFGSVGTAGLKTSPFYVRAVRGGL